MKNKNTKIIKLQRKIIKNLLFWADTLQYFHIHLHLNMNVTVKVQNTAFCTTFCSQFAQFDELQNLLI